MGYIFIITIRPPPRQHLLLRRGHRDIARSVVCLSVCLCVGHSRYAEMSEPQMSRLGCT